LALHPVRSAWRDVAIGRDVERSARAYQVLIQIGLLAGEGKAQPLGENLVMAVSERPVSDFATHNLAQGRVKILTGERIAEG